MTAPCIEAQSEALPGHHWHWHCGAGSTTRPRTAAEAAAGSLGYARLHSDWPLPGCYGQHIIMASVFNFTVKQGRSASESESLAVSAAGSHGGLSWPGPAGAVPGEPADSEHMANYLVTNH